MTLDLSKLFRLTEKYIIPASLMFDKAFFDDPLSILFFPDAIERRLKMKYIFEYRIRYGLIYGEVYAISSNLEGLAVWIPPENIKMTKEMQFLCGRRKVINKLGMDYLIKMASIFDFMNMSHAQIAPFRHWYLSPIAVDPRFQGKGYASILLRAMMARTDKEGLPVYLETHLEKNVQIYKHFGFKILSEEIIPNSNVTQWSMCRSPFGEVSQSDARIVES